MFIIHESLKELKAFPYLDKKQVTKRWREEEPDGGQEGESIRWRN